MGVGLRGTGAALLGVRLAEVRRGGIGGLSGLWIVDGSCCETCFLLLAGLVLKSAGNNSGVKYMVCSINGSLACDLNER